MSKNHKDDAFFLDTGLLRDHVSKLREQKKTASRLYANVSAMKNCSDPTMAHTYNSLLRDIEHLIIYLDRMASVLSNAGDEAIYVSLKIGAQIQRDTAQARQAINRSFML